MAERSRDVLERVDADKGRYLDELKEYLRIPSISTDPEYEGEVVRCADFLVERMQKAGLTAEKIDTDRHPLVYAEWTGAPGKKTVLFYGHYDVQPVDPVELWRHPPFEPTVEDDRLYARGATDDKGQSYTHVKAVEALLQERGRLPVNVKFLIEGEEESGGESIDTYVREDGGQRLATDCVVISDTGMLGPGQPTLIYSLRGLCYMEIRVTGPRRDLHSGTYGGAVANPLNALAYVIAALRDPDSGRVQIPGFYDAVLPLEEWESQEFAALPFDAEQLAQELGVPALVGEEGFTYWERVWARPTCDVHGLFGGYQGEGAKTVLPSWGGAKVSMRLVPEQEPERIASAFTDFVRSASPAGVRLEAHKIHTAQPVRLETEGPIVDAAMAAMEEVWGAKPVRVQEGGSIPIVSTLAQVLEVPILLLGFGLPDDALHAPNEKIDISQFHGGIRAIVRLLDRLGELE